MNILRGDDYYDDLYKGDVDSVGKDGSEYDDLDDAA